MVHTSQKNSLPRRPQNHEIHETSSELLISETDFLGMHEDSCRETLRKYIEKSIVRDLTCSYTPLPRDSLLTMKTSKSLKAYTYVLTELLYEIVYALSANVFDLIKVLEAN